MTQKLQEVDLKFSIFFVADEIAFKITYLVSRSTLKAEIKTILI